jgi:hypothetical protein
MVIGLRPVGRSKSGLKVPTKTVKNMVLRREFMQLSLGAAAGSLLPLPLLAETPAWRSGSALPLFKLLHDTRQPDSLSCSLALGRQLLGELQNQHSLLQPVHGDVTRFWYDQLQPLWRQQRAALAGTTPPDVLFCLEQLARDHGLRVLWREQLLVAAGPPLVSWLIAAV